ncbi:aminoglycoside adenylyltransferase domain-containing protein [Acuticoccus kandeliae]|uniref:aminoglycoside adenylyltransferase domain-containing protein n=1 Tax=Acuticoccus kandeliae TaxID=2073160 RepID=UPI00196AF77B|nr:aminoglycoside adenylyltransferase domain-containing protein [Acuticoccus kandeliae]
MSGGAGDPWSALDGGAAGQVRAVAEALRSIFGEALVALLLHGSAVSGGMRPESDIDLIAVLDRRPSAAERSMLLAHLLRISGLYPARAGGPRPIELTAFTRADLDPPTEPAHAEFVYGEWLRAGFEAGAVALPSTDPEFTLLLAQARREAQPLFGPALGCLMSEIPADAVRRAIGAAMPSLLDGLDGDTRNVLLTLARMWRTVVVGDFVPKDSAAEWALARLPEGEPAAMLDLARRGYRGAAEGRWDDRREAVRRAADALAERVTQSLRAGGGGIAPLGRDPELGGAVSGTARGV